MPETKKIQYGNRTLDLPAGMTLEEAKGQMARFFPELSEARVEIKKDGDTTTYTFSKQAGRKGALAKCASCGKRCDSVQNFCYGCQRVICLRCVEIGDHRLNGDHALMRDIIQRKRAQKKAKA